MPLLTLPHLHLSTPSHLTLLPPPSPPAHAQRAVDNLPDTLGRVREAVGGALEHVIHKTGDTVGSPLANIGGELDLLGACPLWLGPDHSLGLVVGSCAALGGVGRSKPRGAAALAFVHAYLIHSDL
jgi:hypothetical protein